MSEKSGLKAFFVIAGSLLVLRVLLAYLLVPIVLVKVLTVLSAIVFIGAPIYAIFRAGSHGWTNKAAFSLLVPGALLHVVGALLFQALPPAGFASVFVQALGQTGILIWTLALGVLLALFIRDKNLMIPVAIFLVGFDMFLVFNPSAPTAFLMRQGSINAQVVLMTVPQMKSESEQTGRVESLAFVGPADLLFSAAFFTLLFRFGMRPRQTLNWLIPVLVVYLVIVIFFGTQTIGPLSLAMLPAMVPIGLTVLIVNRREFKLEKQELLGVLFVAAMAVALAWYGIYRASTEDPQQALPAEPLPSEAVPEGAAQEGSPQTAR
ncbi:MAG: hypothetical protein IIC73_02460 [Armatimonadetes bacterium]|nr:hypothetical protein [Armatimonadota bacterium]